MSLARVPLLNFLFFFFWPNQPTQFNEREGDGNQTFNGDGLTSEALQYQFYIFFKQFQEHLTKTLAEKKHGGW